MIRWAWLVLFGVGATAVRADDLLYSYEGDVLPYEDGADWIVANPCDQLCTESLDDGHFVLGTPIHTNSFNYHHWIAYPLDARPLPFPPPPPEPPLTLWVEWRFRSNHPMGPTSFSCDGWFYVHYQGIREEFLLYGDAAFPASGIAGISGLVLDEFHTFRFETLDGVHFSISANGNVFLSTITLTQPNESQYLQFGGDGGCGDDWVPNMRNEWDFIRYGTIKFGERIVESNPPTGFLRPDVHGNLDRFTVTYDSPNYAYIDDITVSVTCATAPNCPEALQVIATRRLDNGPSEVLEIVLDRPLSPNARTVFTFTDVDPTNPEIQYTQTVAYTFQLGDVNADGQWNLLDFASMQNCIYQLANTNTCAAFDFAGDIFVDSIDHAAFLENAFP